MTSLPTITIDLAKKCAECGKPGTAPNGICLKCTTKALGNAPLKSEAARVVRRRFREMRLNPTGSRR